MDNEIATLLKGLAEKVGSLAEEVRTLRQENVRLAAESAKMAATLRSVDEAIRCGGGDERPWDKYPQAKAAQIEAVVDYLRKHPKASVNVAVDRTFAPAKGGFASAHTLKVWCYRRNIHLFS